MHNIAYYTSLKVIDIAEHEVHFQILLIFEQVTKWKDYSQNLTILLKGTFIPLVTPANFSNQLDWKSVKLPILPSKLISVAKGTYSKFKLQKFLKLFK